MTRSAPEAVDWNSNVTALLVIGSALWFGSIAYWPIVIACMDGAQVPDCMNARTPRKRRRITSPPSPQSSAFWLGRTIG